MPAPNHVITDGGGSASFASSHPISLNLGTGPNRAVLVEAVTVGGASGSVINSITAGGVALTLSGDESLLTQMGSAGRFRAGWLHGATLPEGVQDVVVTASDSLSRVSFIVTVFDVCSAVSAATMRPGSTSFTPTVAAAAATNERLVWLALTSALVGTQTIAATAPSTLRRDQYAGNQRLVGVDTVGVGAGTTTGYTVTGGATPGHSGHYWVLTGTADPSDLSGGPTAGDVVASGSMSSSSSDLAGDGPLGAVVPAGTLGQQPGVLTLGPVHQPVTGVRADGASIPWVSVNRLSDGVQVAVLTAQTVNGSGMLVLTHGSIVPGVAYAGLLYNGTVVGCGQATAA